jgi:hypothetical protein
MEQIMAVAVPVGIEMVTVEMVALEQVDMF